VPPGIVLDAADAGGPPSRSKCVRAAFGRHLGNGETVQELRGRDRLAARETPVSEFGE